MILFEKEEVWGFEHAIRGMRNPMNSWERSDSGEAVDCEECGIVENEGICFPKDHDCTPYQYYAIGENDRLLMVRLIRAGTPHRKFLRQIFISVDITAPLYWWKEFDTYKVGTTANSCSTMHKIAAKEFTVEDFSHEHLFDFMPEEKDCDSLLVLERTVDWLNHMREKYLKTKDKQYWWQMIQLLPSSYNQKRTVTLTYENLLNILEYRRGHKLDEWREFCDWILTLPHAFLLEAGIASE
jgi:hypothetical protein